MIYILKFFEALLLPPLSAILFIIWGLLSSRAKNLKIAAGVIWLCIASTPMTAIVLYKALEAPYVTNSINTVSPHRTGIILGGYLKESANRNQVNLFASIDRLELGRKALKFGVVERLLLTGGNVYQEGFERSEAVVAKELLIEWGIDASKILVEDQSRTTYENALNSARILGDNRDVILITSASHMRRSMWAFEKVGFRPTALVAEPLELPPIKALLSWHNFLPNAKALKAVNVAIHELLGIFAYKVIYR